ncbi:MAG: hypothetical protein IJ248_04110, partial [Candidatus Methanomethylophilaceae archaeon]|nr:hypothetical protein [Candidatus Methanomethylophilaceae archaeon]
NWYEVDGTTRDYKYYQEPIVIQKGGSITFYEVFQIPSGSSVIDVSLDYHGDGKVSRDNHILDGLRKRPEGLNDFEISTCE